MTQSSINHRRIAISRHIAAICFLALMIDGCNRQAPVPLPIAPPPASPYQEAEASFAAGNYTGAINSYVKLLSNPDSENTPSKFRQERSLFRLGVIYALPENPGRDFNQARVYLARLLEQFPQTKLAPEVQAILGLQSQLKGIESERDALESERQWQGDQIERLNVALERVETDLALQSQALNDTLRSELEALESERKEHRDQIERVNAELNQVRTELETLKQIDMGRQPID